MKNSELYQLAFQLLTIKESSEFDKEFSRNVLQDDKVLLRFIRLCSNHFVLPAIYSQIKRKGFSEFLQFELAEHLEDILQLNIKRNTEILDQIDEINLALSIAGIEPVYMKGTAHLLDNLYTDKTQRIIGDIDFLVKDKDFLPTAEIVLKLGYKTDVKIYDEINSLKDYPRLFKNDVPADIEIHRLPVIPEYAGWFTTEMIFSEKKQIPGKLNCFVPGDKHKVIQNFIHSQLTNKGHKLRLIALREIYDCHLLLKRVNKTGFIDQIREKEKAEIYFDFIESLTNGNSYSNKKNNSSFNYKANHTWFLDHPRTHFLYINAFKIKELLLSRFFKAFVDKQVFKNLWVRIKKREWWQQRVWIGLKDYFS